MASTAAAVGEIMLYAVLIGLLLGAIVWLSRKGYLEPSTNEETLEEREELAESVGKQDFSIPFRKRAAAWSLPMKVMVGSLVLLAIAAGVATYQVMKTGSPAHEYLTREIRMGIVTIAGIGGGVRIKSWSDEQIAHVDVEYERAGQENVTDRIPYAKNRARVVGGSPVVPVVAKQRFLGLFWRFKQVGEDRRTRGTSKPLDDVFHIEIPDHATERSDGSGYHVVTYADEEDEQAGDVVLEGPTSTADLTWSSPNSLSDERATELRQKRRRMKAELDGYKATNAELYKQIKRLRKSIENEEYDDEEAVMDKLDTIAEMFNTLNVSIDDKTRSNGAGSTNGAETEEASAS